MVIQLLAILGILTAIFALLAPVYFASKSEGYSPIVNTLSELGVTGGPHQLAVSRYYFLPLGVSVCVFLVLGHLLETSFRYDVLSTVLLSLVGTGYIIAAFFPCDAGAPVLGSVSNQIHNVAGVFEYLGAGFGLILMGAAPVDALGLRVWNGYLILSGSVILLSLVLLILPLFKRTRGLLQRVAEASFFIWMLSFSLLLLLRDG
ncbi:DUF998 domain-containing protein [Alkalimarinus coralli]|uniref:DUF998 domain-containing protein n=1 Tax=Alkalimarinus coralli TaxID=2935863 RepID=UPI00202B1FCA|nr:DUF998 domain-containing protein [Alkalimarinus coralli]